MSSVQFCLSCGHEADDHEGACTVDDCECEHFEWDGDDDDDDFE